MKLSIIVPYRNREQHLEVFLDSIKDKVKENFDILVVEQNDQKPFNRGKLSNIGFDYKKNISNYFCFHDVDMIPTDVDYSFTKTACHLASKVSQFNYKLPAFHYCGGVILFNKEFFERINGYSNEYWGWGAEDTDLYCRIVTSKEDWHRRDCTFESLPHKSNFEKSEFDLNIKKLYSQYKFELDGLNNLSYTISEKITINSFTDLIKVNF